MDSVAPKGLWEEEWVIRKTKEKRGFLHDLEDGVLDRWRRGIGNRVQIERNNGDSVRELL